MTLSEMLATKPPPCPVPDARRLIRESLVKSGKRLVVVDDDPTGMQTVQDVSVLTDWSVETLKEQLGRSAPVFFVSINSRSLNPAEAADLALTVGRNLREAADSCGIPVLLLSRSDSTLRGHFPCEVDALLEGFGLEPDGIIFTPAFFEAGRYTIDDAHWAATGETLVPVHQTEFACDPMFPFKNSNLKAWVEEKTSGRVKAADVICLSLDEIRTSQATAVMQKLMSASRRAVIIPNAAGYDDLDAFALALQQAEDRGKTFIYRSSASFVKSRGGFEDRPLLSREEMVSTPGPALIVAGSYVDKTSRQLQQLLASQLAVGVELDVHQLPHFGSHIQSVTGEVERNLKSGISTVLFTSRRLHVSPNEDFAETGRTVMQALCHVVSALETRPAFIIAKGGITSIQVAKSALGVRNAFALGQVLPGVPVWRLGPESRWPGMAYVVFPGNVGDDTAVLRAFKTLSGVK